jgi:acyl transferase domain-containing protein
MVQGTGTAVGDPLELGAVAKTLAGVRDPGDELFVGSVKSNVSFSQLKYLKLG